MPEPRPTKGAGSPQRWLNRTPAMAAGLTNYLWTVQELLLYRVPPSVLNIGPLTDTYTLAVSDTSGWITDSPSSPFTVQVGKIVDLSLSFTPLNEDKMLLPLR
ncbi:MAG: hypothetical protein U0401_08110 [Anaerolineae bacterium]